MKRLIIKRFTCIVVISASVILTAPRLFAAKKYTTLQCDIESQIPKDESTGFVPEFKQKLYIKGDKVRLETPLPFMTDYPVALIKNGEDMFIYDPVEKTGDRMRQEMRAGFFDMLTRMRFDNKDSCQQLVGTEKVDGKDCDVYACSLNGEAGFMKVWVDKSIEFPVKASMGGGYDTYYKNVKVDEPVDDSFFALPPDIKIAIETLYDRDAPGPVAVSAEVKDGNIPVDMKQDAAGQVRGNIGQ